MKKMGVKDTEKRFQELQLKGYDLEVQKANLQKEIAKIVLEQQEINVEINQMVADTAKTAIAMQNSPIAIPEMQSTFKKNTGGLR
ncbi:MAG: hypothetical protein NT162_03635 [Candidatus Woesebacteria bacterium]|nr:hypothetical protein [Candidatus Woesebacteria bacterium]